MDGVISQTGAIVLLVVHLGLLILVWLWFRKAIKHWLDTGEL